MSKKVLVVDDEKTLREIAGRFLKLAGHTAVLVENGKQAWELVNSGERFDLIISDYQMSVMNGLELLGLVRWNSHLTEVPFVLMSAMTTVSDDDDTHLETICAGFDATFVSKPFFGYEELFARFLG